VRADPFIFAELEELALSHPVPVIQILSLLVNTATSSWSLLGLRDHGVNILRACLADTAAQAQAETLIHRLGAKGYSEFGRLLKAS
jgi:hypothetical protein